MFFRIERSSTEDAPGHINPGAQPLVHLLTIQAGNRPSRRRPPCCAAVFLGGLVEVFDLLFNRGVQAVGGPGASSTGRLIATISAQGEQTCHCHNDQKTFHDILLLFCFWFEKPELHGSQFPSLLSLYRPAGPLRLVTSRYWTLCPGAACRWRRGTKPVFRFMREISPHCPFSSTICTPEPPRK